MDPRMGSGRKNRAQGVLVAGTCSLNQLAMKLHRGERGEKPSREGHCAGWGLNLTPTTPHCFMLPGSESTVPSPQISPPPPPSKVS